MNFHVSELQIGINEFDHRNALMLLKQEQERSEKFKPFS